MYIYRVRENGINCDSKYHRNKDAIPNGWTQVPENLEGKELYINNGKLTDVKPQILIDKEQKKKNELKQKRIAFEGLIQDLVDREEEPHSDDELVELRKDVQMLKQMLGATLDYIAKENKG